MFGENEVGIPPFVGAASPCRSLLEWHLAEEHFYDRLWIDPNEMCFAEHGLSLAPDRYPCSLSFDHMHQTIRSHFGSSYPAATLLNKEPTWYG